MTTKYSGCTVIVYIIATVKAYILWHKYQLRLICRSYYRKLSLLEMVLKKIYYSTKMLSGCEVT